MQGFGYTASVVHRPRWAYAGGPRALPRARLPKGFPEAPRSFPEASQGLPESSRGFPEAPRSFQGLGYTASVVHRPRWAYNGGPRALPRGRLPRGSHSAGFRVHGLSGPPASVVHRPRWSTGLGGHALVGQSFPEAPRSLQKLPRGFQKVPTGY